MKERSDSASPSDTGAVDAFNEAAFQSSMEALCPCENCGRKFKEERWVCTHRQRDRE